MVNFARVRIGNEAVSKGKEMNDEMMVSVICTVYNQERYIRQCLESLVQQQTTFRYEVLVHDDASKDNSAEIIKEFAQKYPSVIIPVFQKENQYSQGINPTHILLNRARGKYVAVCEGDDFWISQDKLEKQVDFMERHPEYSLCVHAAYYAKEDGTLVLSEQFKPYETECTVSTEEILSGWKFATNSILYRREARKDLEIPYQQKCSSGDFATLVYLALQGKVYYMPDVMSAYRVESIGSLNWTWKKKPDKYIQSRREFANMLRRIDAYTSGKYHQTISRNIEQVEFSVAYAGGNLPEAKKNKALYDKLEMVKKVKLYVQYYFPGMYEVIAGTLKR